MGLWGIYKSNICLGIFSLLEFVSLTDKVKVDQNLDLALYNSKYDIRNSNHSFTKQINRAVWGLICSYHFPMAESLQFLT